MTVKMQTLPQLTKPIVTPASRTNGDNTTYTITITPDLSLIIGDYIEIIFPEEIALPNVLSICTSSIDYNSEVNCHMPNRQILSISLISLYPTRTFQGRDISFVIRPVTNPPSTKTTSAISVNAFDSTGNQIAELNPN